MKTFTILPFIALAFSYDVIRPGTLHISRMGNLPIHRDLFMEENRLVTSSEFSTFDYGTEGTLEMLASGKYLSVDEHGKLVLADKIHKGFSLRSEGVPPRNYRRTLVYNGSSEFELCADNSIGFQSNCDGARTVRVSYEDIVQPR